MTDSTSSDARADAVAVAYLTDLVATAVKWLGRAALAAAIGASVLGILVWLLILATDVAPGLGDAALLLVCAGPGGNFVILWWGLRRARRIIPYFAGDVGVLLTDLREMPERVRAAFDRLQVARGFRSRISALRDVAGTLRGSATTADARDRFERLYATVTGIVPLTATLGSIGTVALVVAIPVVLVVALIG